MDGVTYNGKRANRESHLTIVGLRRTKQDPLGWWNRLGKVILNNRVRLTIRKDDGWDVAKEYRDVGASPKDGTIVRGIR